MNHKRENYRQRNLSFSPELARIHHQTSFQVDQPIEGDRSPAGEFIYTTYLRRRLENLRTSSMDEQGLRTNEEFESGKQTHNKLAPRARGWMTERTVSFDDHHFDELHKQRCSSSNLTSKPCSIEHPKMSKLQSFPLDISESDSEDSQVIPLPSNLDGETIPVVKTVPMSASFENPPNYDEPMVDTGVVSESDKPRMQKSQPIKTDKRLYKTRLQSSATHVVEDMDRNYSQAPNIFLSNSNLHTIDFTPSPSPHPCNYSKLGWNSRLARYKSLQRSRTIEANIHNVRSNQGYVDAKMKNRVSLGSTENCSVGSPDSLENNQELSEKHQNDHLTPLLRKHENMRTLGKTRSVYQRSRFDEGTTQIGPSMTRLEKTASVDIEGFRKTDSRLPFYRARQTVSLSEPTHGTDAREVPIQISASAVADGLVEDFVDPSKQSTSSYLKEQFFAFFQPSDNKLAMKLFGSKSALNKEKRRQRQHGKWIIHPCSSFRFYWDLLMLTLLIANLIILPVAISFFYDDLRPHWIVFNSVSDAVFIADIAVKFRTGIIANDFADEIILSPKEIARQYVRSWFLLDLISSIPMDYIFWMLNKHENYNQILTAGRTLRILRLAKLLGMLRLLRLTRLVRYISQWEEFLNIASKFMGIFNLVLLMLLLGHWNACLQFLIPLLMDYPEDSWVQRCKLKDADWFEQYTWALFKAMSHMLSIGYGRFPPTSTSEAWITIVSMMTGTTCYALFVGHAAALIQSFDTSKRLYREKFKQVEEYMAYRKLPRALRQRIADYYEHRYQGKMFDETQILTELSECLREQIINYNCRELVAAVPFFTYADQDFVSEMVTNLKFEVFQPGDLIIKEGAIGTKMYFIQEGIVDIITKDGEIATTLSDGSYFGEICLLTNTKRTASVRAEVYSNLYSLDRDKFVAVLENYPLMRRTMESVAAERLSNIGQNPAIVSSREDLKEDLSLVKEIVSSVQFSDESSTGDEEYTSEKDELSLNRLQRVIQKAKRKATLITSIPEDTTLEHKQAVGQNAGEDNGSKYLRVRKVEDRKQSGAKIRAFCGVSKLFKRGGVFGEHMDDESEAYLSWDRERQKRYRTSNASLTVTTPQHLSNQNRKTNFFATAENPILKEELLKKKGNETEGKNENEDKNNVIINTNCITPNQFFSSTITQTSSSNSESPTMSSR